VGAHRSTCGARTSASSSCRRCWPTRRCSRSVVGVLCEEWDRRDEEHRTGSAHRRAAGQGVTRQGIRGGNCRVGHRQLLASMRPCSPSPAARYVCGGAGGGGGRGGCLGCGRVTTQRLEAGKAGLKGRGLGLGLGRAQVLRQKGLPACPRLYAHPTARRHAPLRSTPAGRACPPLGCCRHALLADLAHHPCSSLRAVASAGGIGTVVCDVAVLAAAQKARARGPPAAGGVPGPR